MRYIYMILVMIMMSGCEDFFDNITCNYQGYPTQRDSYRKCYYINDVGIQFYIDDSFCNCLF